MASNYTYTGQAAGSLKVLSDSTGFCVARTIKGCGIFMLFPSIFYSPRCLSNIYFIVFSIFNNVNTAFHFESPPF